MKKFTKVLCLALSAVMAFALVGCGNKNNYTANNTTYKIGVSGPLTGAASVYGEAVKNSAQMAIDEINANGGLDGVNFELLAYDDANDSSKIATNYNAMMEKGMNFSLGTVTTKPCLEFKELANDDNLFFITPSSSGDEVTKYETGFQMCYADSNLGLASADYFNKNYANKQIGILYQSDNDYSNGIYKKFMAEVDKTKFPNIVEAPFTSTTQDFSTAATKLQNCSVLFMPIYYTEAQLFMEQAKGDGNKVEVYFGADGFDGLTVPEGVKQEVSMLTHFASDATEGPAKKYVDDYKAKFPGRPLNQFGASTYDCVYAIYDALKYAKTQDNKEFSQTSSVSELSDILKSVFTNNNFEFRGVTGKCEGNEKSRIKWAQNGTVKKEAVKFVIHAQEK